MFFDIPLSNHGRHRDGRRIDTRSTADPSSDACRRRLRGCGPPCCSGRWRAGGSGPGAGPGGRARRGRRRPGSRPGCGRNRASAAGRCCPWTGRCRESASKNSRPSARRVDSQTWAAQPGTLLASTRSASGRGARPLPRSMTYSMRPSQSPSRSNSSTSSARVSSMVWAGDGVGHAHAGDIGAGGVNDNRCNDPQFRAPCRFGTVAREASGLGRGPVRV